MQQELQGQIPECKKPRGPLKLKVMEDTMVSRKMQLAAFAAGQSHSGPIYESEMDWGNEFEEGVANFPEGAHM